MTTSSENQKAPLPASRPRWKRGSGRGRWKWWLLVLSAFILGIGVGIFGTVIRQLDQMRKLVGEQPAIKAERVVNMLDRRLDLTDEQRERVEPIVDATQRELLEIRLAARPEVAGALMTGVEDIEEVLEPDQREKLAEMITRYQEILGVDLAEQAQLSQARTLGEPKPVENDAILPPTGVGEEATREP